jgi:hypothetical protein
MKREMIGGEREREERQKRRAAAFELLLAV